MNPSSIRDIFRNHYMAFIFAVFISLFMVGPELFMRVSLGDEFRGIYMHGSDSELFYLSRMRQTYNGESAWDNPYLHEYRGRLPIAYALFSEPMLAYPGKWLGIPVPELNLIYKFVFSGAIFLLIYSFMFRLCGDRWWSIAVASCIMGGYKLVTIPGILNFIQWKWAYTQFSIYSRPVTAQASWVIFWGFLHLLLSGITSGKWKYFLWNGVLFGLAFYVYPYNWTFLGVFSGVVATGAFFLKQRKFSGQVLVILCIGAIIAIPYILNAYAVTQNEYFNSFSIMTDLGISHKPDISKLGLLAMVLLLVSLKRRGYQADSLFVLALLTTTFVVTNQQVVTGHVLQVGHYHLFFNVPIYILIFLYVAWRESSILNLKLVRAGLIVVIAVSFMDAYIMQSSSFSTQTAAVLQKQKYSDVFHWLNANTQSGSVVLANENISSMISVYAHNHVYWNSFALFYLIPTERLEKALFMSMKLNRMAPAMLGGESFFHTNPSEQQLSIAANSNISDLLSSVVRKVYREDIFKRYTEFYRQSLDNNFKQFRLDYIVYDPSTDARWNFENIKFLKPVQKIGGMIIYENTQ